MLKIAHVTKNLAILFFILYATPSYAALSCSDLNGAYIYSQESTPKYLGFFGNSVSSESINTSYLSYGATWGIPSVRNTISYGSTWGAYSAENNSSFYPPKIYKHA